MNRRDFFQVAFASKHGRREVMKRDLDWYVVIMLNFVIGLTCCEAKNMGIEVSPATAASFSLPSCIQVIASKFLTFLGFYFDNCYLIFEWEYSFLSTGMESTELLYATTTSLINDLEVYFSNSSKIMLSCRNTIVMLTSQKRKKEVKVLIFALQFEIFAVEDIAYVVVKSWKNAEESVFDALNEFSLISIFNVLDILNAVFVTVWIGMNLKCEHALWIHKILVSFMKESYDFQFSKDLMAVDGRHEDSEFDFKMMSGHSTDLIIQWDPGKLRISTVLIVFECGWKGFPSIYDMLNFVYDRGKLGEILCEAKNHKLEFITQSWQIFMQGLHFGFMSQTQIFIRLLKSVNEVRWRMALTFSWIAQFVFDRGKVLMEAKFNLEDKVVLKGWVLLET
ncbi:protein SHORTAGE IN CHIASMATA [Trifolium repens]|nr:protein SHORTAGE IN CHIASMATA [Trifolium repens]